MGNIVIFQPYLSNRPTSSGTVERQFRFLKSRIPNQEIYALFDSTEDTYAETLRHSWIKPIIKPYLLDTCTSFIRKLVKDYNITELYIARTYFTPCKEENIKHLRKFDWDAKDDRYWRDWIPMLFAEQGVKVYHMIYDPLELQYDSLIEKEKYKRFSSMNNVPGAEPHIFADLGYYDINKEIEVNKKDITFCFGGTAMSEDRANLLKELYKLNEIDKCKVFIRTKDTNNLVDNSIYEDITSKALFTYTIPSQNPKYVSFTRMLLALSQGTIPLIHPDNNLDCLFGKDFEFRDDLKKFFNELIISSEDLIQLLQKDFKELKELYSQYLYLWYNTKYYKWLQENVQ